MALAREGKQRAWWQQFGLPYATYVGLEAEATSISDYNPDIVPGCSRLKATPARSSNLATLLLSPPR